MNLQTPNQATDEFAVFIFKFIPSVGKNPQFSFDWNFNEKSRDDPDKLISNLTPSTFQLPISQVLNNLFASAPNVQNNTVVDDWSK